jgi:uncharacterized protein (DUF2147 family)
MKGEGIEMWGGKSMRWVVVSLIGSQFVFAGLSAAGEISGHWSRGDGVAKVKIEPCGDAFCAVNTWIKDPAGNEKVGDRLIFDIARQSDGSLKGTAFDPQRDMNYNLKIQLADDKDQMTTKGCVVFGLLCKSMSWTRLD